MVSLCRATLMLIFISLSKCAREAPTIAIPNQGKIRGEFRTLLRTQRIIAYLGIPYAQPPIQQNRFAPPIISELPAWDSVRNSTITPDCMQRSYEEARSSNKIRKHDELFMRLLESQRDGAADEESVKEFSEDCLYLNVFVPEGVQSVASGEDGRAVLVWFHGGDFIRGSPHDLNPFQIVFKQNVIFVSVAYRLNIFGFFTSLDWAASGNFGLMDQSAALVWIQNNIEHFGGNKDNVCLFGQGSGAISVGLHLTSEYSSGLFQKAIAMSGNVLAPDSVKTSVAKEILTVDQVALRFGCYRKPTNKMLSCLRGVRVQALLDLGEPLSEWKPIVDNGFSNDTKPFIMDEPNKMYEQGLYQRVPMLTGFTNMEAALLLEKEDADDGISLKEYTTMIDEIVLTDILSFGNNDTCYDNQQIIFDAVEFFYSPVPPTTNETILRKNFLDFFADKVHGATTYKMASIMSKESSVFLYRFDLKPLSNAVNVDVPSWVGVAHNFDLVYVFGLPFLALPQDYSKWESSDKRVADIIMKMWVNFAKFSNPTNSGVYINWEPFNQEKPGFLIIDRNFNMSNSENVNYIALEFWNNFYPKILQFGTRCCNESESKVERFSSSFLIILICYVLCCFILE